jgi:chromosome segregation ATPase
MQTNRACKTAGVNRRAVDDLRELARRDEHLAAEADRLRELDGQVAALRATAEAIDAFFAAYPEEETRRRAAVAEAESELDRRREELTAAEAVLATATDDDERSHAERGVERARDHVAVAETAVERARAAAHELERDASRLPSEVPQLEERAHAIAAEVPHMPAAPAGPRALVGWASHAHAELFVAAGQLDAQRERVIREANELASMLLGEPTYGSTVAQLAKRVGPFARE